MDDRPGEHHAYDPDEVLAELSPAPARWAFGVLMLFLLGVLIVYLGLVAPGLGFGWRLGLVVVGALALLSGERSRRSRYVSVLLTNSRLVDSLGQEIARLDQITGIDRGAMAFKPSNGFLLHLDHKPGRAWVPGLWWRFHKFVGVGGSTQSGPGKFMAEIIALKIAERDGT